MTQGVRRRPMSIAILAVFSVIYGVLTLIPKVLFLTDAEVTSATLEMTRAMSTRGVVDLPATLQIALAFVGSGVALVGGVLLWRGSDAGRWAIAIWMSVVVALHFLQTGVSVLSLAHLPGYALILFVLFRPRVAPFFRGGA